MHPIERVSKKVPMIAMQREKKKGYSEAGKGNGTTY